MAGNTKLKLMAAGVVLTFLMGSAWLASAKEEGQSDGQTFRAQLAKTLNLRPDEVRILTRIEEKYDRIRQEAIERINKSATQMDQLLSGGKPDEGKVKELTSAMAADQDILVNTYKGRRDEIMASLTPVQKGAYLLASWKRQQNLLDKYGKQKTGEPDEAKKPKAP